MHIFHYGLVLVDLSVPYIVKVLKAERPGLDTEPDDLFQFLNVLGLVERVLKDDLEHAVLFEPKGHTVSRQKILVANSPGTYYGVTGRAVGVAMSGSLEATTLLTYKSQQTYIMLNMYDLSNTFDHLAGFGMKRW